MRSQTRGNNTVPQLVNARASGSTITAGRLQIVLHRIRDDCIIILRDWPPHFRGGASLTLGQIGDEVEVSALTQALHRTEQENTVLYAIVKALGQTRHPDAVRSLSSLATTKGKHRELQIRACEALDAMGPLVADAWLDFLHHSDDHGLVRKAAQALGELHDDRAVERLLTLVDTFDDGLRTDAAEAIGKIAGDGVSALAERVKADDPELRATAAAGLGFASESAAGPPLLTALDDEEPSVRSAAIHALSRRHDQAGLDAIAELALSDDVSRVRYAAAQAVANIGGVSELVPLVTAMRAEEVGPAVVPFYCEFIERGIPGSEKALIAALRQRWHIGMTLAYLNCGNSELVQAAKAWAGQNGYAVESKVGENTGPRWGSQQQGPG